MLPATQPTSGAGTRKDFVAAGSAVANPANDTLTLPADLVALLAANTPVQIVTAGVIPAGLAEGVTYFVIPDTTTTIKLAAVSGGASIDFSSAGTLVFLSLNSWTQSGFGVGAQVTVPGGAGQSVLVEVAGCVY
jgi:hypothetical protein